MTEVTDRRQFAFNAVKAAERYATSSERTALLLLANVLRRSYEDADSRCTPADAVQLRRSAARK
jgi:hypothetical protein